MTVTKKYTCIVELTPEILNSFVDEIVIHESVKLDGKQTLAVDIYYSYGGIVDVSTGEEMWAMEQEYMRVPIHKQTKYRRRQAKICTPAIHINFCPYLV